MTSSLEKDMEQIEECAYAIDNIIENTLDIEDIEELTKKGSYIDSIIAFYLQKKGLDRWIDNDYNGPQINYISEKALMMLEQNQTVYHQMFNIVSEDRNRAKYFRIKKMEPDWTLIGYKDIEDIDSKRFDVSPDSLESIEYKN